MSKLPTEDMSAAKETDKAIEDGDALAVTAGARLLEARQAKALNLRDVAAKTRQSRETLEALESMETDHMPASLVRLQAKNYARFLGLPEEEIASGFAAAAQPIRAEAVSVETRATAVSTKAFAYGAAALVVTGALIGGGMMLLSQPSASDTTDPLAISARLAPAYAEIDPVNDLVSEASEEFAILANERAWIEVRGSDGTVFRNRDMAPGEAYYPRIGAGWTITVRDAGAFRWQLGDIAAMAVGEPGQALYSISVDDALAMAVEARSAALAEAPRRPGQQ